MRSPRPDGQSLPLADLLKNIVRKSKPSRKALEGRRLAQETFVGAFPLLVGHASVVRVKLGVVTIETNFPALVQELEGFQQQKLLDAFRAVKLNVKTVRVKLSSTGQSSI